MKSHAQDLNALRHSAAHLLAAAVLEHFKEAQIAIGPAVDDGFYYDIDFGDITIVSSDLKKIEQTMRKIVKTWYTFERLEVSADEAKSHFPNNPYKLEMIDELSRQDEIITLYQSGNFVDLCRGGHAQNPSKELIHFKLTSIAGAYWRGDEQNAMLTRVYGTAYFTKEDLEQHFWRLEEAKKRDHKRLGPALDLFTFSQKVGAGLPLWTPKGMMLRSLLDDFVWRLRKAQGYVKVDIPHITKKDLFETSGHWEKFSDELFKITTREGHIFAMKPMNCPFHTQIFDRKPHSYREMPQRYANTTMVYRDEQSGELAGLSRVRSITQDDAHVFCRKNQIQEEMMKIWDIIDEFYAAAGFNLDVRLSLSDPKSPEKYLGNREQWLEAENMLRQLGRIRGVQLNEVEGEAAFYGPKLDFMAKDSLGREWQVATNQLDMNMPVRFGLTCTNEQGEAEQVYMLHAAIMGSIERYLSILIEHFAGAFPLWLSPVQTIIIPIGDDHQVFAKLALEQLKESQLRVELWTEGSMQKRIRQAEQQKIPYMLIIGDAEVTSEQVSVRTRGHHQQQLKSVPDFIAHTQALALAKSLDV